MLRGKIKWNYIQFSNRRIQERRGKGEETKKCNKEKIIIDVIDINPTILIIP